MKMYAYMITAYQFHVVISVQRLFRIQLCFFLYGILPKVPMTTVRKVNVSLTVFL